MLVGVISDTHGLLRPEALEALAGVEHILHAGDIGDPLIALELGQVAPVTVVLGNTDLGLSFCETEIVGLAARKFLVHHIVNPHAQSDKLKMKVAREQPDAIIFGHTHKRFCETIGGILFFNPGYSGKPKSGVERSIAILHCDEKEIRAEFLPL